MFILKLRNLYVSRIDRTAVYCSSNPHEGILYKSMPEAVTAIPDYLIEEAKVVNAENVFRRYDGKWVIYTRGYGYFRKLNRKAVIHTWTEEMGKRFPTEKAALAYIRKLPVSEENKAKMRPMQREV